MRIQNRNASGREASGREASGREASGREAPGPRARRGITLVEVVVAVTLLGIIVTSHTLVTMRFAMRGRTVSVGMQRAAAVATATDLFSTMPFASIATNTGCATIAVPATYPHQRCVTTSAVSGAVTRVQVIITPTNTALRPDTVTVDRSSPPTGSLFAPPPP